MLKGLFKRPLFALMVVLIVSLLGILVFRSGIILKSLSIRDFSFLTASLADKPSSQDLFVTPAKNFLRESPQMSFIQKNSLIGVSPPAMITTQVLGTVLGDDERESRKEIIEYIVEQGDALLSIATKFNISLNTVLWANDLTSRSVIKPSQKLIILPVSGVVYNVKKGDTLSAVAKIYKGKVEEIIAFNELSDEGDIFIGDILIIPNGEMPTPKAIGYTQELIPIGSSYFICPLSNCKITQGLHWYNAIDFGGKCGEPIYAAAAGVVLKVKYGWNGGAGNYLSILHPNGVVTTYGHISANLVNPGQEVSQGQFIALMGGQPGSKGAGISTGCHLHFDVRGGRNPFAR